MKLKILLMLVVSLQLCSAQEIVTKIVKVNGNPSEISVAACPHSLVQCTLSPSIHAIVIRGQSAAVADMEKTIQELDGLSSGPATGNKNVEITVYVIAGSKEPIPDARDATEDGLLAVVRQLKPIFPYAHYQLLGTMLLRSAQGASTSASGIMKSISMRPNFSQPSEYKITYHDATISPPPASTIKLSNFQMGISIPVMTGTVPHDDKTPAPYATTQYRVSNVGLGADVDLREGQKVVVGKTNVSDSDTCFFIVLSARLVP